MCLFIYIASDHPLPLKPWNEKKPDFHVSELSKELKKVLRQHFDFSHIRLTGSSERCGCFFNYGREYPNNEYEPNELFIAQESRQKLFKYLKINNVKQIYSCWTGDEAFPIESRKIVCLDDILGAHFVLQRRELLTVWFA